MSVMLLLGVGLDESLSANDPVLRSSEFFLMETDSIAEAVDEFRMGDFDILLLGPRLTLREKEKLTILIRSLGSRIPVVCVGDSSGGRMSFANATLENNRESLITGLNQMKAQSRGIELDQAREYRYAL